jgi:hypothetical protein
MALSTLFGYTNTTQSATKSVKMYDLDELSNYSRPKELANSFTTGYSNMTCPDNLPEVFQLFRRVLKSVNLPIKITRPSRVKEGCNYGIRYVAVCGTTDSNDPTYESNCGIQARIELAHVNDPRITDAMVETCLERALSLMKREDGTWRIDELRRGGVDIVSE